MASARTPVPLTSQQRDQLLKRARAARQGASPGGIPRRPDPTAAAPLSFAQRRLWFLWELQGPSPVYNIPIVLELRGDLAVPALRAAVAGLAARHSVLRTRFRRSADEPVQEIAPALPAPVPLIDLAALPPGRIDRVARDLYLGEAKRAFDLTRLPLVRMQLLRRAVDRHVLTVVVHHIVADGWSLAVYLRELQRLYEGFEHGEPPALPPLRIEYADFAVWEREHWQGEALEREVAYWRRQIAGAALHLDLPLDRPRPAGQSWRGRRIPWQLPAPLAVALRAAAGRHEVTLFMLLLAGIAILLGRYSAEESFLIGTAVANRAREGVADLLGFFVNLLPIRVDLAGHPPAAALLHRVRDAAVSAFAHQELSFDRLVDGLGLERHADRQPLIAATFTLQNLTLPALQLGAVRMEPVAVEVGISKFDLSWEVFEDGGDLCAVAEYNRELFDAATVARSLGHYHAILSALAGAEAGPVDDLSWISPAERQQLLREWQEAGGAGDRGESAAEPGVLERWRRAAAAWPDRVAVAGAGREVRYGDLARRVARGAAVLRAAGVGPEVRVAVLVGRSPELLVSLLSVLAAGGAAVPLAAEGPRETWAGAFERLGAEVVLAPHRLLAELPEHGAQTVAVEALAGGGEGGPWAAPPARSLAWVVETAGVAGRPRAAALDHAALAARALGWDEELAAWLGGSEAAWGALATSRAGSAESLFELLAPLLAGGRVVLGEAAAAAGAAAAPRHLVWCATPTRVVERLRGEGLPGGATAVRWSGEALPAAVSARLDTAGLERVWGVYETAVAGAALVSCDPAAGPRGAARFRVAAGARAHVVDAAGREMPVGVVGELACGGDGLARGLDAMATADCLVPDALSGAWGGRLYRTGDRARWDAAGRLEVSGRMGRRPRVRGLRLDPAAVEAALRAHPALAEVAVAWREAAAGDGGAGRLVAYVASLAGAAPSLAELREWLRGRVAEALLPAARVDLAALAGVPRTPSGRFDRRHLPAPVTAAEAKAPARAAPCGTVETALVAIWQDILERSPIGVEDNFFALGGHSLLALRVASRVRQVMNVEVPVRVLLEQPTVAGLARWIEAAPAVDAAGSAGAGGELWSAPALRRREAAGPAPLSFAQERLWFLSRMETAATAYNLTAAMRVEGRLEPALLARAMEEVMRRQEALRARVRATGADVWQEVMEVPRLGVAQVDLAGLAGDAARAEVALWAAAEGRRPFDLEAGPLVRMVLLRCAAQEQALVFSLPHIVADGWSMGVLVRELAAFYARLSGGEPAPLPPLAVQYADYASWQRQWLQGEALERGLSFWRDQLAGMPEALELPFDRPRPAERSVAGGRCRVAVSARTWDALQEIGRRDGATGFMVLLAGWQVLLARWSGQVRLVVGTVVTGRERAELEPLIGCFVNALALPGEVGRHAGFAALVEQARRVCLAAYSHQEVPFERLVKRLAAGGSLSHSPLFQVMLNLHGFALPEVTIGRARLTPLDFATATAKFDLSLGLGGWGAALGGEDGLLGELEYSRDLFDAATIERLGCRLEGLLWQLAARPEQDVWTHSLLLAAERQQLLREWQGAGAAAEPGVVEQWRRAAAAWPDRIAVADESGQVRYRELAGRVDRAAAALRASGVGPEVRVAVLVDPGSDLLTAVLAVLAAGGAAAPLAVAGPREGWAGALERLGAEVVLAPRARLALLPEHGGDSVELEALHQAAPVGAGQSEPPLAPPSSLGWILESAEVMGRARAVALDHGALSARARAWRQELARWRGAGAAEWGVLATSRAGSVESLFELLAPLLSGGRVVMGGPGGPGAAAVPRHLLWCATPARVAAGLRGEGLPPAVTALRWSGEALPAAVAARLDALGLERIWGVHETAVGGGALAECGDGRPGAARFRPTAGARVFVLDALGQPVPAGVVGDLVCGGGGLARGLDGGTAAGLAPAAAMATADCLVPDPLSGAAGERLCRTGDRARWDAAGRLEVLGRAGCRRLPAAAAAAEPVPLRMTPGDEVEAVLLAIWEELLGHAVGVEENFFAAGGDSILGLQMANRALQAGLALTPLQLFQNPTVEALARIVRRRDEAAESPDPGPEEAAADVSGLTPIQQWFFDFLPERFWHWNQAVLLAPRRPLAAGRMARAVAAVLDEHAALRQRFGVVDGRWRARDAAARGGEGLAHIALCGLPPARRGAALESAARALQASLDLERGPLVRVAWLDLGAGRERLLWIVHHLATDAVSWSILLGDLARAYAQLARGERVWLGPRTASSRSWAAHLERYMRGGEGSRQAARWRALGWPEPAAVPADAAGDNREGLARSVVVTLDEAATAELVAGAAAARAAGLDAEENAVVEEVLLAALALAWRAWSGAPSVLVDREGHGREDLFGGLDLSRTVGWFTAVVPLLLAAPPAADAAAVLAGTRETLRRLPRPLQAAGALRRQLAEIPRPAVSFNYLGRLDHALERDTPWELAPEPVGPSQAASARRPYLLDLTAGVAGGQLQLVWRYGSAIHGAASIERLAACCLEALRDLLRPGLWQRVRALAGVARERPAGGEGEALPPLDPAVRTRVRAALGAAPEQAVAAVYPLAALQEGILYQVQAAPSDGLYVLELHARLRGPLAVAAMRGAWAHLVARHDALRTGFVWEGLPRPLQAVMAAVALPWAYAESPAAAAALAPDAGLDGAEALKRAPLLRLQLVREAADCHRLQCRFHHLVMDGWSMAVLVGELGRAYYALAAGREPELGPAAQYGDYIAWLERRDKAAEEGFWRGRLDGFAGARDLELGVRPGGDGEPPPGACERLLDGGVTARLHGLARHLGVTLYSLVAGAWALTLGAHGAGRDVVFGTVTAGRPAGFPGIESMVGLLINTIPTRVGSEPGQPVGEWLRQLHEEHLLAQEHQHAPLVEVRAWSGQRAAPLFDTVLVFENFPVQSALGRSGPGLDTDLVIDELRTRESTDYRFTLQVSPGERLGLRLAYAGPRAWRAAAAAMLGRLETVLTGLGAAAARPGMRLDALPVLDGVERQQLLIEWQGARVETEPAGAAASGVVELWRRAAAAWPERAVVEDGPTVLRYRELAGRVERATAVLRAAGVRPGARVAVMVERSPELLVALLAVLAAGGAAVPLPVSPRGHGAEVLERLAVEVVLACRARLADLPEHGAETVAVEELDRPAAAAGGGPPVELPPRSLAWVVQGTGAAGEARAVAIDHAALAARARGWRRELESRVSGCGAAGWGVLAASPAGSVESLFELLAPLLAGGRVVLGEAAAAAGPPPSPTLPAASALRRLVGCGAAAGPAPAWAVYETAAAGCVLVEGPGREDGRGAAGRFRPAPGALAYLLDEAGRPVPAGVTGELVCGGAGLALALEVGATAAVATAAGLVPDGLSGAPGGRLHRTGLRARWDGMGGLEVVGRLAPSPAAAAPAAGEPVPAAPPVPPRDAVEAMLVEVWEDLLQRSPIGVEDNFFALGGHSLLALRLVSRLAASARLRLPLSALLAAPTIAQLARRIRGELAGAAPARDAACLVALQPAGHLPPFFWAHPVGGTVFCYRELASRLDPGRPSYGLQAAGSAAERSLEEMAGEYVAALRTVQAGGPYLLGGWSMGGVIAFEMACQLRAAGEAIGLVALVDPPPVRSAGAAAAPRDEWAWFRGFAADLLGTAASRVDLARIGSGGSGQWLAALLVEGQRIQAFAADLELSQVEERFLVFRRNVHALERYTRRAGLDVRLLVAVCAGAPPHPLGPARGWDRLAGAGAEVTELAGDHYSILEPPGVEALAAAVRRQVAAAGEVGARAAVFSPT